MAANGSTFSATRRQRDLLGLVDDAHAAAADFAEDAEVAERPFHAASWRPGRQRSFADRETLLLADVLQEIEAGQAGGEVVGDFGVPSDEGLHVRALAGAAGGQIFVDDPGQEGVALGSIRRADARRSPGGRAVGLVAAG